MRGGGVGFDDAAGKGAVADGVDGGGGDEGEGGVGAELLVQLGGELGAGGGVVDKLGAAEQGAYGVAVHGGDTAVR